MLAGAPAAFVRADVALDGEPVIGSFTVEGLTFAVTEGSSVELVGASPDRQRVAGPQDAHGSPVAPMLASGADGIGADGSALAIPESITYEGIDYTVSSIGAYAFYLSGVASVALPASIAQVDERTFRSSDVAAVEVAEGNASYSSFDGALYSADYSRLLLIPEGKQGAVRMPSAVVAALPSAFSHCAGVDAISADAGGAAFASENGLLYDASLATLIRVPAGATDITIRDGCTTIAAGALEGCAQLTSITAPASITSVSPDVFTSVPTVSLPAALAMADDPGASTGAAEGSSGQAGSTPASGTATTQLTAMVALSSTDDDLPEVHPSTITVNLPEGMDGFLWRDSGFSIAQQTSAELHSAESYAAFPYTITVDANGGVLYKNPIERINWEYYPGEETIVSSGKETMGVYVWQVSAENHTCQGIPFDGENGVYYNYYATRRGYSALGFNTDKGASGSLPTGYNYKYSATLYALWRANTYTIAFSANGGTGSLPGSIAATYDQSYSIASPSLSRKGYAFDGWATSASGPKAYEPAGPFKNLTAADGGSVTLYAHWSPVSYPVAFDLGSFPTSDEPGSFSQEGWGGSRTFTVEDGTVALPSPVRAGMRFLSWECDQPGLLSQDGTAWTLDCTALPDASAPTLTARWSYAIDVDTPVAVTFGEYDMATGSVTVDGSANPGELDDGYDTASKRGEPVSFKSASKCDVGIEGLSCESREGIALIKAKAGQASDAEVRAADLITMQVGGGAPTSRNSVSFALDDALGKDDMAPATAFVIPAEGELSASFRLNLEECGAYVSDASAGPEPAEVDLAQLTYAYRAIPYGTGEVDGAGACTEDMYIPYDAANPFGLADIKAAANDIAARGYDSQWWWVYKHLMYADERGKTIAKVKVGATYHDVQVLGLAQDRLTTPTDGRELAGLTFGWKDIYAYNNVKNQLAGGDSFSTVMTTAANNAQGWYGAQMRNTALRTTLWGSLGEGIREAIVPVNKFQQLCNVKGFSAADLQATQGETIWLPSMYEVFGLTAERYNESEGLRTVQGYEPFQYQAFSAYEEEGDARFVKQFNGTDTSWSFRSCDRTYAHGFLGVNVRGLWQSIYPLSNAGHGVVPCFCL